MKENKMTKFNVKNDNALTGTSIKIIASDNPKEPTQLLVSNGVVETMDNLVLADTAFNKKLDTLNKGMFGFSDTCLLGIFVSDLHEAVKDATGLDAEVNADRTKVNAVMRAVSPKFDSLCTGDNKTELARRRADAKKIANTIPQNLEVINGVTFINFEAIVGTNDISNLKPKTLVQKISKNKTAKDKKTKDAEPEAQVIASDLINDMFMLARKHNITEHAICKEMEKYMVKYQSEEHAKAMSDLQAKNKERLEAEQIVNNRIAHANAKKLNAERKKAEAPKIAEDNKVIYENRLMAMGGNA